jgi:hypothetical protein
VAHFKDYLNGKLKVDVISVFDDEIIVLINNTKYRYIVPQHYHSTIERLRVQKKKKPLVDALNRLSTSYELIKHVK